LNKHSSGEAFLEAAVFAPLSGVHCHFTVFLAMARKALLLPNGALEERFTALTADHSVVTSWR